MLMSIDHRPLIGWSDAMERLRADIQATAPTNMTVMIRGERGTGKELVAREIHLRSNRAGGPFIRVNCASLPETLMEAELFGCEKGSYTGAVFRRGRFEQAHGGSLFLDEIGELSITAQPKLLRVLEEHEVDRIGGQRPVPVDFRLIVATNRNLEEMGRTDRFRDDLYDRLNMDSIRIPALRERIEDIPVLAEYFIGACVPQAKRLVSGLSHQVLEVFQQYSWPGNIRELKNLIARGVFKGRTELIRLEDLSFDFGRKTAVRSPRTGNHDQQLQDLSRQLIIGALAECDGNRMRGRLNCLDCRARGFTRC